MEMLKRNPVTESTVEEFSESDQKYMNEAEKEALESTAPDTDEKENTLLSQMNKVVATVNDLFDLKSLGSFVVSGYSTKKGNYTLNLVGSDLDITVTIKDPIKYGIVK